MAATEDKFTAEIESTYADNVEHLEALLERNRKSFHPNHYLVLIVKWLLIRLYGRLDL